MVYWVDFTFSFVCQVAVTKSFNRWRDRRERSASWSTRSGLRMLWTTQMMQKSGKESKITRKHSTYIYMSYTTYNYLQNILLYHVTDIYVHSIDLHSFRTGGRFYPSLFFPVSEKCHPAMEVYLREVLQQQGIAALALVGRLSAS